MTRTACDVLTEYGLESEAAIDLFVAFWDRNVVCQILCDEIDRGAGVDDFAEFIEGNFGVSYGECLCDSHPHNPTKDDTSIKVVVNDRIMSDDEMLAMLCELEDDESMGSPPSPKLSVEERIGFWKWMSSVVLKICEHPAMRPDADPVSLPDFDSHRWKQDYLSGMTVDEAAKADAAFNINGW